MKRWFAAANLIGSGKLVGADEMRDGSHLVGEEDLHGGHQ